MDQKQRIARIIREYDGQGWHRTGTQTDHESARWLAAQVGDLGLEVELEGFELSRIDPDVSCLEVAGQQIVGLPMFDGAFTGPEGIRGRIGPLGSTAEIGLGDVARSGMATQEFQAARQSSKHQALVAVTLGGRPGLMATNAQSFRNPFGPPVLQVGSQVHSLLSEHAQRNSEAHLILSVNRTEAESFNVVGRLKGADQSLAPLAIMTPRTGWWHCAGERGGGLACWLEVMRAFSEAGSLRDVVFLATSAHELGLRGIDSFLERRPGFATKASAWVHFGANIGAALEPGARFSATDDQLERQMQVALAQAGAPTASPVPRDTTVGAESQVVASHGGRVVAMVGGNAQFHLESDRWPDAVDVEAVAGFARAFNKVALQLAGR